MSTPTIKDCFKTIKKRKADHVGKKQLETPAPSPAETKRAKAVVNETSSRRGKQVTAPDITSPVAGRTRRAKARVEVMENIVDAFSKAAKKAKTTEKAHKVAKEQANSTVVSAAPQVQKDVSETSQPAAPSRVAEPSTQPTEPTVTPPPTPVKSATHVTTANTTHLKTPVKNPPTPSKVTTPAKKPSAPLKLRTPVKQVPSTPTKPVLIQNTRPVPRMRTPQKTPRTPVKVHPARGADTPGSAFNSESRTRTQFISDSMPLPPAYKFLYDVFCAIDVVLGMQKLRKMGDYMVFGDLVEPVRRQGVKARVLLKSDLGKIRAVYPEAYNFDLCSFRNDIKVQILDHPILPGPQSSAKKDSAFARRRVFHSALQQRILKFHEEYLFKEKRVDVGAADLKRWDPETLSHLPEITPAALPETVALDKTPVISSTPDAAKSPLLSPRQKSKLTRLDSSFTDAPSTPSTPCTPSTPTVSAVINSGTPKHIKTLGKLEAMRELIKQKQACKKIEQLTKEEDRKKLALKRLKDQVPPLLGCVKDMKPGQKQPSVPLDKLLEKTLHRTKDAKFPVDDPRADIVYTLARALPHWVQIINTKTKGTWVRIDTSVPLTDLHQQLDNQKDTLQ